MTVKLDCGGYLLAEETSKNGDKGAANDGQGQQQNGEKEKSGDPPADGWEDEDTFRIFKLKCGSLLPIDGGAGTPGDTQPEGAHQDYPAHQRLYNLGYGDHDPKEWDDQERRRAVTAFQRKHKEKHALDETGEVDDKTRAAIRQEHGG
jgi:hypothetical protein